MTELIALITGANRGIGFETARQLGARGMTVLLGARDETRGQAAEAILTADNIDAHYVRLDVTDAKSAREAADWIDARYGRLDILVNNAGIAIRGGPPSATPLDGMREVFETNVFGVITVTNAMLPLLRRAPRARIVNVSSEIGSLTFMSDRSSPAWQLPPSIPYPAYCATDLNGRSGFRTAAEGASVSVHLATLPDDGPTGTLWGHRSGVSDSGQYGDLPW